MMEVTGVQPSPFQQYYFIKSTCCEYYAISGTTTGTSLSLLETLQHLIALITLSILEPQWVWVADALFNSL